MPSIPAPPLQSPASQSPFGLCPRAHRLHNSHQLPFSPPFAIVSYITWILWSLQTWHATQHVATAAIARRSPALIFLSPILFLLIQEPFSTSRRQRKLRCRPAFLLRGPHLREQISCQVGSHDLGPVPPVLESHPLCLQPETSA